MNESLNPARSGVNGRTSKGVAFMDIAYERGPNGGMAHARRNAPVVTDLARRLRERREVMGLSQEALARRCVPQLTSQSISRFERGADRPSPETLERLAEALDTTERYLRYGDEPRPHIESIDVIPPQFQEWLDSPLAAGVTAQEIETLRGFRFPYGHPGVGWYSVALAAMRAGTLGVPNRQ